MTKRNALREWSFVSKFAGAGAILAGVLWLGFALLAPMTSADGGRTKWTLENYAQFGDAMAPITAVATVASFFVVFCALLLQTRELRLQRRALRLQRDEMADQRVELAAQTEQMKRTAEQQERAAAALERAAAAWERTANAQDAVSREELQNVALERSESEREALANFQNRVIATHADLNNMSVFLTKTPPSPGAVTPDEAAAFVELQELAAVEMPNMFRLQRDVVDWSNAIFGEDQADDLRVDRDMIQRERELFDAAAERFARVKGRLARWWTPRGR